MSVRKPLLDQPAYYTTSEVADIFGVDRRTIGHWVRIGLLKAENKNKASHGPGNGYLFASKYIKDLASLAPRRTSGRQLKEIMFRRPNASKRSDKKTTQITSAYYTSAEAAQILGVHSSTIRVWASEGLLRAEHKGHRGPGNGYLFSSKYIDGIWQYFVKLKMSARHILKQSLAKKTHNIMK